MSDSTLTPAPGGYPIKLVRDNTPAIINTSGEPGALWYGPLPSGADHGRLLRLKLAEEVGEYLVDGGWGELRDVLAVVCALAVVEHASNIDVLREALANDPRGGFIRGVVMYGRHPEYDR